MIPLMQIANGEDHHKCKYSSYSSTFSYNTTSADRQKQHGLQLDRDTVKEHTRV